jgi:hypothetical protein
MRHRETAHALWRAPSRQPYYCGQTEKAVAKALSPITLNKIKRRKLMSMLGISFLLIALLLLVFELRF